MIISTEIASASAILGEERAIEELAKAGFDAWDFSMFRMCKYNYQTKQYSESDHPLAQNDYLKFARKLKKIGLDNGIYCNQSHAPFPSNPQIDKYLKRAIECTAEAGGKVCVIHPYNHASNEENAELYHKLLPFAKDYGVKIATENMWKWDEETDSSAPCACSTPESFNMLIDTVNDDFLVACLDIGHTEMRGSGEGAAKTIKAMGNRIKALHIHDNDKWHDSHQIPFSMDIDFIPIMKALKEIGYSGELTLEADAYLKDYKDRVFEGIKNLADSAKKLREIYENI